MGDNHQLANALRDHFASQVDHVSIRSDMVTVELTPERLIEVCIALRDEAPFKFELLLDICGVDYLDYCVSHWRTEETTTSGFSSGYGEGTREQIIPWNKPRFGVVY